MRSQAADIYPRASVQTRRNHSYSRLVWYVDKTWRRNPVDEWASASGLPQVDSVDVWPMISGVNTTSPRETILVNEYLLIHKKWKYVAPNRTMIEAARGGPRYPNATTATDPIDAHNFKCPPSGCLFDLENDVIEQHEVSAQYPDIVKQMQTLMAEQVKGIWSTTHTDDPACKQAAADIYGGFYGPWRNLSVVLGYYLFYFSHVLRLHDKVYTILIFFLTH